MFNYWPPTQPGVALAPSHDHFRLIPEFVDTVRPPAGSAEAPTHSAILCGPVCGTYTVMEALCFNGSQTLKDKIAIESRGGIFV